MTSLAVQLHTFEMFCYTCKEKVEIRAADKKAAQARFGQAGHSEVKVPALAPNFGRSSRRYERAIEAHRRKEAEARRAAELERDAAKKSKEIQG